MKNIYHKINIHYSYIFLALSCILIGYYKNLLVFSSLIFFHELGHIIIIIKLKYKIKKITLYSFGGIINYEENLSRKINEDLLLSISGILFQNIFIIIIIFLKQINLIPISTFQLFINYNITITIFNFLPIIPLDGSKALNLLLCKILPFNKCLNINIIISLITITIILILIQKIDYNTITILTILLYNIYKFYKEKEYYFNKLLLEKYLYNYKYKKLKIINNFKNIYKEKRHIIKKNNKYQTEKEFLKNMFDIK